MRDEHPERLQNEEGFDAGLVRRAGEFEGPSLRERFGPSIDVEVVTGRLSVELVRRAQALTQERDAARTV